MSVQDSKDTVDTGGDDLADLLANLRRGIELDLRVCAPGHVTAYNPTTQTATIQLANLPVKYVEDEEVVQPPIVLPDVPVCWPGSAFGYITTPLVAGDTGIVLFSDRCLAAWRKLGIPTDPINGRAHNLGDGMFVPGLRPKTAPITPPTDLTATVVEGLLVSLGRGATQFGLRGTSIATAASSIHGVLNIVAAATDPATVITLANANKAAILALLVAIQAAVSTKVRIE